MGDARVKKFAQIICSNLDIAEDDEVLILAEAGASPLVLELQKEILFRSAYPEIRISLEQMHYVLLKHGEEKHLRHFPPGMAREIEIATKLISIDCPTNPRQMQQIAQERLNLWNQTVAPFHSKLDFIPIMVTIFPNTYYADKAEMSLEDYEYLFYKAVSVDYEQLYERYARIEKQVSRGNEFVIRSSNTDLKFVLQERNFTLHSLVLNLPDGEMFCSPLENSVEGYIKFGTASYNGKNFPNLYLQFSQGQITKFDTDGNYKEFAKLLDTDTGAKKLGKFGFGINPAIQELTHDILFDEKLAGTCNISLGDAYPEVGGTNRSAIHFDIVKDMRNDGEILMDGRVIYHSGRFCI